MEKPKHLADAAAMTVTGGTLLDRLPEIAAAFSILWFIIRIWESQTIQNLKESFYRKRKGGKKRERTPENSPKDSPKDSPENSQENPPRNLPKNSPKDPPKDPSRNIREHPP